MSDTPQDPIAAEVAKLAASLPVVVSQITPDETQQEAIDACCDPDKRIVAVSGEAGTGKTRIIKQVYDALTKAGYLVGISAPTGKAAKRIQEATGLPAMTNHRMLGYGMPLEFEDVDEHTGKKKLVKLSTGPTYKPGRPLPWDFFLCDEYAMVNREIHRNLIGAGKPGARYRFFGDTNQLKPIEEDKRLEGEPSPFMVALQKFTGIVLTKNYRQQEGSGVIEGARRILIGRAPVRADDFALLFSDQPIHTIQKLVKEQTDTDLLGTDAQIITCMNKSWIGTKKLNLSMQSLVWQRDKPYMELMRHKWEPDGTTIRIQHGSKVVYTANTYDLGNSQSAFNGEVGTVVDFDDGEGTVEIDFGDRVVTIPPLLIIVRPNGDAYETDPRMNIDLAYVLTTHKMQGSEVDTVCYVLNKSTTFGQSRRNFYTAVSRARRRCIVVTDQVSLAKSVQFNK